MSGKIHKFHKINQILDEVKYSDASPKTVQNKSKDASPNKPPILNHLFFLFIFKSPKVVINEITKLQRTFLLDC